VPNLRDIRTRIRSVKNTQKITRAMKMVAAAKLRKAQAIALARRPYGRKLGEVLGALAHNADLSAHPLFQSNDSDKTLVVVVTSDRGLCGGFNTNLCKQAWQHVAALRESGRTPELYLIGKKGNDYFRRRDCPIVEFKEEIFARLAYDDAKAIADDLIERYQEAEYGEVVLIYNEFLSVMAPRILVEPLLPVSPAVTEADRGTAAIDYEYEPDPAAIFAAIVPWHVRTQVWRVLQESWAAELASRMTAMESATKNAGDMIEELTLFSNKVRQAAITRELIEVVSGAAALD